MVAGDYSWPFAPSLALHQHCSQDSIAVTQGSAPLSPCQGIEGKLHNLFEFTVQVANQDRRRRYKLGPKRPLADSLLSVWGQRWPVHYQGNRDKQLRK